LEGDPVLLNGSGSAGGSGANFSGPVDVVLTMDSSGSMNNDGWDDVLGEWQPIGDAKVAAKNFVDTLETEDRAAVVDFDRSIRLAQDFTRNKALVKDAITALEPGGSTSLYDATIESIEYATENSTNTRVVIVLTDGHDTASVNSYWEAIDCVRDHDETGPEPMVYVFTIGLGTNIDYWILENLSTKKEYYYYAPTSSDLNEIYNEIATEIQNTSESEIVSYEWDFEGDGIYDYKETKDDSPDGIFDGKVTHIYGDNGLFNATLRITDDKDITDTDSCNMTVLNVEPEVTIDSVVMNVEVGIRVAGRKFNDIGLTLYEDNDTIGYVSIERMPGSPDDQMAWIPVSLDMTRPYSALVTFTPEDPPNIGGNPVWIYVRFPNGSITRIHHTFNVQQSKKRDSDHWNHVEPWEVDLNKELIGCAFDVNLHVTDPGSDDEVIMCNYYSQNKKSESFCNPPLPDPYPSPEFDPRDLFETTQLIYEGPGALPVLVKDDDGGLGLSEVTLA
jgi:uncharacterized protein YegL